MLGKLLKYDLKWNYQILIIFYILSLVFSCIGRGLVSIENSLVFNVVGQISIGAAISMMISSVINSFMRSWVRFVRNVYKDESYLTHTLPVKKSTIYLSKVLAATICVFTTGIVILLCLAICYYSQENIELLKSFLEIAASTYSTTVISLLLMISIVFFLEVLFIILIGYTGIIIGHEFSNRKMGKSILIGFLLYIVTQLISLLGIFLVGLLNPQIMNLVNTTEMISIDAIKIVMYGAIALYTAYILIYYFIGKKQFEKGVNVE